MSRGIVYLIGAGPGDPGLITVRGRAALMKADVVLYDRLGTEALMHLCRPDARLIDVGKAPDRVAMTQDDTTALCMELGRQGLVVARLKGGDPFVFGRGAEGSLSCRRGSRNGYRNCIRVACTLDYTTFAGNNKSRFKDLKDRNHPLFIRHLHRCTTIFFWPPGQ